MIMYVVVDWLQSVHVVSTARRVVSHVIAFTVLIHVTQCQDDVIVSPAIMASIVTDVSFTALC